MKRSGGGWCCGSKILDIVQIFCLRPHLHRPPPGAPPTTGDHHPLLLHIFRHSSSMLLLFLFLSPPVFCAKLTSVHRDQGCPPAPYWLRRPCSPCLNARKFRVFWESFSDYFLKFYVTSVMNESAVIQCGSGVAQSGITDITDQVSALTSSEVRRLEATQEATGESRLDGVVTLVHGLPHTVPPATLQPACTHRATTLHSAMHQSHSCPPCRHACRTQPCIPIPGSVQRRLPSSTGAVRAQH